MFHSSAFATNKEIRCHFGSSTTSKSDMSSYRYSEGSSLFRKSVLHRIRFGNTVRLKAELPNSAASSLRTNDLPGSDRRPSRSLSAYPDQWMLHHHHRRLSSTPPAPVTTVSVDNLSFRPSILSQKTLDNIPAALGIDSPTVPPPPIPTPILSMSSLVPPGDIAELEDFEKPSPTRSLLPSALGHFPDCVYANHPPNSNAYVLPTDLIRQRRKSSRRRSRSNSNNDLSIRLAEIESESSSVWTNEGLPSHAFTTTTGAAAANPESGCTCQLLWQLERDTDSIDKFKLFFKRDHLNVDWDYVQGSSEV